MLHNNIKLNILNGIMFKKRPLRCDSDGVRAKTWTLGVWGWTLTECVHSKAWLRAVWGVTLTECVQRCWLLVVCGFEKILMTGLAEARRGSFACKACTIYHILGWCSGIWDWTLTEFVQKRWL